MQTEVAKTVAIFRNSPEMQDYDAYKTLTEAGLDRRLATRLILFVPMAYAHVLMEHTGAQLAETFQQYREDGTISPPIPLASEPVFTTALQFARREKERGIAKEDFLCVARRSSELISLNKALWAGEKLEDCYSEPTIVLWPEEGPDAAPSVAAPNRPWWRFWR